MLKMRGRFIWGAANPCACYQPLVFARILPPPRTELNGAYMLDRVSQLNWVQAVPAALTLGLLAIALQVFDVPRTMQLSMMGAALSTSTGLGRAYHGHRWAVALMDICGKTSGLLAGLLLGNAVVFGVGLGIPGLLVGAFAVGAYSRNNQSMWWLLVQSWLFFALAAIFFDKIENPYRLVAVVLATQIGVLAVEHSLVWLWRRVAPNARRMDFMLGEGEERAPILTMGWQGAQCAAAVGMAFWVADTVGLSRPYWAPMTTLFVLRPDLLATRSSVATRLVTTLIGAVIATGVVMALPGHWLLPYLFVGSAFLTLLILPVGFPVFVAFLTATVIFMVTQGNASPVLNAEDRVLGALIGGLSAFVTQWAAHALWRRIKGSDPSR
ncbi:FUSC family protein [Thioclava sp. SK-1]|uniref:FUSC family protein n=1 Tax=Thioclava sp. SK-1 TaxID=1889770 RepID=UPI00159EFA61|nr:FUSC family protein [Thioclava sp. SK-1]